MRIFQPVARVRVIVAVLALCLSGLANAQWWDSQARRPKPGSPVAKSAAYKRADIQRASAHIQQALMAGDLAKVERMHDEFLALQLAGGSGRWMMQSLGLAFDLALPQMVRDRPRMQALFASWKERHPDSKLRPTLEAAAWSASAWSHRGEGYASTVSPEAMALFGEDNARALEVLEQGEAQGKASPLWYQVALGAAGATGRPPEVLDALFEEGVARFPLDLRLYRTRLNFLLPRWGGSYERVDDFIRRAVVRTQATEGTSYYAILYHQVRRSRLEKDFFGGTRASWKLMRHGFEDGIALEGDEEWLHAYATFACIAEDHVTLRRLMAQLGPEASIGTGLAGVSPDVCAAMAGR